MKWIFGGLLVLFLLLLSCVALIPTVISTPKGQEILVRVINSKIPGQIAVKKAKLRWFGEQLIEDFSLKDPEGKELVRFHEFKSSASLFTWLFSRGNIGTTVVDAPYLYLCENEKDELNIHRAIGRKKHKTEKSWDLKGDLKITQGEITVCSTKVNPITLSKLHIEISRHKTTTFNINGLTKQGGTDGDISANGRINSEVNIVATIRNFPLALLDQLLDSTLYEVSLGKTLNGDIEIIKQKKFLHVKANLATTNLQGIIEGHTEDNIFYLEKGSATFTVTPPFFKALFHASEWDLANRPQLKLDIEQLVVPLVKTSSLQKIPFLGKIQLERTEVNHQKVGALSFNDIQGKIATDEGHLLFDYSGTIRGAGEPTELQGLIDYHKGVGTTFNGNFHSLSVDLLELVLGKEMPLLHKVLGEQFTLLFAGKKQKEFEATFTIDAPTCQLTGSVQGPNLEALSTQVEGEIITPKKLAPFFGPNPHVVAEADLSMEEGNFSIPAFSVKIQNSFLESTIQGSLGEKGKPFDYRAVVLKASGSLYHLPLPQHIEEYEGDFFFNFDGDKNQLVGAIHLKTSYEGQKAFDIDINAKNIVQNNKIELAKADLDVRGKLNNFPTQFFDYYLNKEVKFLQLVGPLIDLDGTLIFSPSKGENAVLDLMAKASGFLLELSFAIDSDLILQQTKPAKLRWELTPERYDYLLQITDERHDSAYRLAENAWIDLTIEKLNCQKMAPLTLSTFFCKGGVQGKIDASPIRFYNTQTQEIVTFENITGIISGQDFSKSVVLVLSSSLQASTIPIQEKSGFSWKIEAANLLTESGSFNRDKFTVKADLVFDLIPVKEITDIIPFFAPTVREIVRGFLGPLMNAHIQGEIVELTGPVTIDIKASNFKGIFPLQFYDGALTLRSAMEAELTLTEEVNRVVLKDINPIIITGAWSDHPLKLYIDKEGFYFPIRNYSFRAISMEHAIIDLGKLRVKNGGDIMSLMTFLKAKEVSPEGVMEAWFTPIYIKLKDGVASYKRFDALLGGSVHIAMWGRVDLNKDKVRMTLGISPATLQKRFNLSGLSKTEMFQVKMRGSTSDLEMDWSTAYTRIGILLTRSAGGIGYLLGGLIEQLMGLVGEELTPPPTTTPFPWEALSAQNSSVKNSLKKVVEFLVPLPIVDLFSPEREQDKQR